MLIIVTISRWAEMLSHVRELTKCCIFFVNACCSKAGSIYAGSLSTGVPLLYGVIHRFTSGPWRDSLWSKFSIKAGWLICMLAFPSFLQEHWKLTPRQWPIIPSKPISILDLKWFFKNFLNLLWSWKIYNVINIDTYVQQGLTINGIAMKDAGGTEA